MKPPSHKPALRQRKNTHVRHVFKMTAGSHPITNPASELVILWPWAFFFIAPFFSPNIFQAPTAVGVMAFTTALFSAAWMHESTDLPPTRLHASEWLFLLLCLIPVTTLLVQGDINSPWQAWKQTLYLTAAWLIYAMSFSHANRLLYSPQWATLIALFAHLYVIYALLQAFDLRFFMPDKNALFLIWSSQTQNFPGPLMQRNMQSLFLVISISFLWLQMTKQRSQKMWPIATILPICGLLLTASRSGMLVLAIAAIGVLLFSKNKRHDVVSMLWPAILAWLIYTWVMMFPIAATSGADIIERIETSGVLPRILVWDMSLHIFLTHPWFGVGWGNLPAHGMDGIAMALAANPFLASTASTLSVAHIWAHNIVLQFLSEGGIFGGAAIFIILAALLKQTWKWLSYREYPDDGQIHGWLMSILILAHGMVSISLMQPFFMSLLALALAACFSPMPKGTER